MDRPEGLPTASELERALIGSMLVDLSKMDAVDESVRIEPADFEDEDLAEVWRQLQDFRDEGRPADAVLIVKRLKKKPVNAPGWPQLLASCLREAPTAAHAAYYAQHVREAAMRRAIIEVGAQADVLARSDDESPADIALRIIDRLEGMSSARSSSVFDARKLVDSWADVFEKRSRGHEVVVPTGFSDCDEMLSGGLRSGELMVAAGRPGAGKTATGLAFAQNAMDAGFPVLFFSLEMQAVEIADRMLSRMARVPLYRMRGGAGSLSTDERQMLVDASIRLAESNLHVVDDVWDLGLISAIARQWQRKQKQTGLIVVDYLQLVELRDARNKSRQEIVAEMTRGFKKLAKKCDSPIALLCQLNRAADEGRPKLSHLRESGAIEQDANQVILLWEENSEDNTMIRAALAKNRNGQTGDMSWVFHRHYVSMEVAAQARLDEFDEYNRGGYVKEDYGDIL